VVQPHRLLPRSVGPAVRRSASSGEKRLQDRGISRAHAAALPRESRRAAAPRIHRGTDRKDRRRSGRRQRGEGFDGARRRARLQRQNPHTQPNRIKKSPAPRFHAFSVAVLKALRDAYSSFAAAFRIASERLRSGDRECSSRKVASHRPCPSLPDRRRGNGVRIGRLGEPVNAQPCPPCRGGHAIDRLDRPLESNRRPPRGPLAASDGV